MPHQTRNPFAIRLLLCLMLAGGLALAQDPLVGSFGDGQLQLSLQGGGGQYSGQISFQGQTFPLTAQGSAQGISGSFQSGSNSFPFQAWLQGDTLTFSTGGNSYSLSRLNPEPGRLDPEPGWPDTEPGQGDQEGPLPAGLRVTYLMSSSTQPGTANESPFGMEMGGGGMMVFEVVYADTEVCLAIVSVYNFDPWTRGMTLFANDTIVGDGDECGIFRRSPAALRAIPLSEDPLERVMHGPWEAEGETFDSVAMSSDIQGYRTGRVYDLRSGLLLLDSQATHNPNPGSPTQFATGSNSTNFYSLRQVEHPWLPARPLPDALRNLQGLHYRGTRTFEVPNYAGGYEVGGSWPVELRLSTERSSSHWLSLRGEMSLSIPGVDPNSTRSPMGVLLVAGGGYYMPAEFLATLQQGQQLDFDVQSEQRTFVEQVGPQTVVIVTQGPVLLQRRTFDRRSGLLVSGFIQQTTSTSRESQRIDLVGNP